MRSLSTELTAAQKRAIITPYYKIALTYTGGANDATYEQDRILSIDHEEEAYNQQAEVILDNSDLAITQDYKGFKAVLSYGMQAEGGVLYSAAAPLWVVGQQEHSSEGLLLMTLSLIGLPNLLELDKASELYKQDSGSTLTVKDLLKQVVEGTIAPFSHTVAYTAAFDSEDSLIDVFKPADSFEINFNETRLDAIKKLLVYTKNVMRAEDDGEVHFLQPTVSGGSYDYEYKIDVPGEHELLSKVNREVLVLPNFIQVDSHPDDDPPLYTGTAEDTGSSDLTDMEKREFYYLRAVSDEQCASLAAAVLEGYQTKGQKGSGAVPLNVGAEVGDYINLTDSRQAPGGTADTRAGNIGYIQRIAGNGLWIMNFALGNIRLGGFLGLFPPIQRILTIEEFATIQEAETLERFRDTQGQALARTDAPFVGPFKQRPAPFPQFVEGAEAPVGQSTHSPIRLEGTPTEKALADQLADRLVEGFFVEGALAPVTRAPARRPLPRYAAGPEVVPIQRFNQRTKQWEGAGAIQSAEIEALRASQTNIRLNNVLDSLHVRNRLRIPVGPDKFD